MSEEKAKEFDQILTLFKNNKGYTPIDIKHHDIKGINLTYLEDNDYIYWTMNNGDTIIGAKLTEAAKEILRNGGFTKQVQNSKQNEIELKKIEKRIKWDRILAIAALLLSIYSVIKDLF